MYQLEGPTNIYKTQVWNINQSDYLLWGAKEVKIEYSLNQDVWTDTGVYTITKGTGSPRYEGSVGPDLQGVFAKYILITVLETYGGACAGFGEWKFYTAESNTSELSLNVHACENDDIIKHINGGMNQGGVYSGPGVLNNYDDSFDFDPNLAGPGTHAITYSYPNNQGQLISSIADLVVSRCTEAYCAPCPTCDEITQTDYDAVPVSEGIFYDQEINSSGSIFSNDVVEFRGSNYVQLNNGFIAQSSSDFLATIRECEEEDNLLTNSSFDNSIAPWNLSLTGLASGTAVHTSTDFWSGNGAVQIEYSNPEEESWHVQLEQVGLTVEANATYLFQFYAKANTGMSSWVSLQLNQSPWTTYGGQSVNITSEWNAFSFEIQTTAASPNGAVRLTFNLGNASSNAVYFDEISLTKID